jgi:NTE family protein
MFRHIAAISLALLTAGCVSLRTPNQPIDQIDHEAGYRPSAAADRRGSGTIWLFLGFSGGGTRAAALAYGVLEELRDTQVVVEGRKTRLLDEVDTISGVSGGSFPAAYYALFGDRIFDELEERFLRRNIERSLVLRGLIPWNFAMLMTPALSRTDLASRYYADHIFDAATFADLEKAAGPQIFINATDLTEGNRFTFSQGPFDAICSDLGAFPISAAVAASSAVPGLLSPLTLRNYAGRCGFEPPTWFEEALQSRDTDPRRYRGAVAELPYLKPEEKRYIHLIDGGIADNLGLRVAIGRIAAVGGAESFRELEHWAVPDHLIVIVVNAETEINEGFDLSAAAPGLLETVGLVSRAQIRRTNSDTLDFMTEEVSRWASDLATAGNPVKGHLVEVSFDHLGDTERRDYLEKIPTNFSLSDEQVDRLIEAGRTLLRESPSFKAAIEGLR